MEQIRKSALELHTRFSTETWFRFVGIGIQDGEDVIYIYCKKLPKVRHEKHRGYRLIYTVIGEPVPLDAPLDLPTTFTDEDVARAQREQERNEREKEEWRERHCIIVHPK